MGKRSEASRQKENKEDIISRKPTIWWINTNIKEEHFGKDGLVSAWDTDDGAADSKEATGCATSGGLVATPQWQKAKNTRSRAAYNIANSCASFGYCFYGAPERHQTFLTLSKSVTEGEAVRTVIENNKNENLLRGALNKVHVVSQEMHPGDIVWMRDRVNGIYYIGQVSSASRWENVRDLETMCFDCANRVTDIAWNAVGTEDAVPGSISSRRYRSAIQRVNSEGASEFSMLLINGFADAGEPYAKYDVNKLIDGELLDNAATFFRFIDADSAEDVFGMWLTMTHGYLPIMSSNKRGTAAYEFTMRHYETGAKCFPQVKNDRLKGDNRLNAQGYADLVKQGDVWLLVTKEPERSIINFDSPREGVHVMSSADVEMLYQFTKDNRHLQSDAVVKWIEWIEEYVRDN